VLGLFSLSGGYYESPQPQVAGRYRRNLIRRCGRAVADNTWVVFLSFPEGPSAVYGQGHMFVVDSRHGWVAWYGSIDPLG
jgi:hypothetical protein